MICKIECNSWQYRLIYESKDIPSYSLVFGLQLNLMKTKKIIGLISLALLIIRIDLTGQDQEITATWLSGAPTAYGEYSHYGKKGVTSRDNLPGGRHSSVTWSTQNGDLYLFGGVGFAFDINGFLNDLWFGRQFTNLENFSQILTFL